jgi:hypothetical protein
VTGVYEIEVQIVDEDQPEDASTLRACGVTGWRRRADGK